MSKVDPTPPTASDLVVAVARHRDRAAFAQLFRDFAPQLKRYMCGGGMDAARADELVQEVMLTVWRRAETFDPRRASAATWIFTIARNKRIDAIRREKHPEVDERDPVLVPAPERSAEGAVDAERDKAKLRGALKDLPDEQARILESAYFEDKSLSAIAAEASVPLGTVKSRVRLAFQRLRSALGEGR